MIRRAREPGPPLRDPGSARVSNPEVADGDVRPPAGCPPSLLHRLFNFLILTLVALSEYSPRTKRAGGRPARSRVECETALFVSSCEKHPKFRPVRGKTLITFHVPPLVCSVTWLTFPCLFSEESMSGKKIYVGGLPYSVSDTQLEELFAAHGAVESARVITDRMTGRSKGFGFVEMTSESEAEAAINSLNGTQLGGRTLTVNEARPRENRGGFGGGGGGGRPSGGRNRW